MRRILVLGAAGFIGRHLCSSLSERGVRVIAATRRPATLGGDSIENVVANFDRVEDFAPLVECCDAVVHAASSSTPGSSEARPQLDGNLRPTLALIEALQLFPDRRLLFLSSGGTIYGDRDRAALESDSLRPRSYHGAGKAAAEHFINAWAEQYSGTAVALRPSNVYGAGQPRRPDFGIIPAAFDCALRRQAISVWGDGSTVRDYLYVDDLVALCLQALVHPLPAGLSVFNASSGNGISLNTLLDAIDQTTGYPLTRLYREARRVDVRSIVPDSALARERLGWRPSTSLADGLALSWRWFCAAHG